MQGFPPLKKNAFGRRPDPSKLLRHAESQNGSNRGTTSGIMCLYRMAGIETAETIHMGQYL